MGRGALHQFVVGAVPGDAITDQALMIQRWLREAGLRSRLFAESIASDMEDRVEPYLQYRPTSSGEVVILHQSIGSEVADYLLSLDTRFILIYHNVTPVSFLQGVDPVLATQLARGRAQLAELRGRSVIALADSPYNEEELRQHGFSSTDILPIALDVARYREANSDLVARYQGGGPYLLFVGRLVPNKCQEDLIKLLYCFRRVTPGARLLLVGDPWVPAYADWLRELAQELEVADGVVFAGRVSQRDLVAYYRLADLYISMSEHEGFGKPLVESMLLELPVMAYAAAAVPGTMGGSGVLFRQKDMEALAEIVDIFLRDERLRRRIVARQADRVRAFLEPTVRNRWEGILGRIWKEIA